MMFLFEDEAGESQLHLKGESFKYLIKVRRHSVGDILAFRSRRDIEILHSYEVVEIEPRKMTLKLQESKKYEVKHSKELHLGWCMIDPKSIEKVLPMLHEIGVSKISFILCDRTQKNFKLDMQRFKRLEEASMQQSGRSNYIEFEEYSTVTKFVEEYPEVKVADFTDTELSDVEDISSVLVGCEGGFSQEERELLKKQTIFRFATPNILRSETAVVGIASKLLL